MRPASCEPIRVLVALAADDELSETERHRLERHLASCGDCRAFGVAVGVVAATVRGTAPERPRHLALVPAGPEPRAISRLARRRRRLARPALKASAVAASIAAAALVGRATTEPPRPPVSAPVILIDVDEPSADSELALVAREYAHDRARFGGDPPPSEAPGPLTD